MASFADKFARLAPLETFDPNAFIDAEKEMARVCDFALGLALIYNDSKNISLILSLLGESKPSGVFQPTKEWGEYNGINVYLVRVQIGLVHELFKLISDNAKTIQHPFFQGVLKKVRKANKLSWEALLAASQGKLVKGTIAKTLFFIRNKVSFHYELKELRKGYTNFFRTVKNEMPAFISRGSTMESSRFYFADATVDGYLWAEVNDENLQSFYEKVSKLLDDLNFAVHNIILTFVQDRGYAWRTY